MSWALTNPLSCGGLWGCVSCAWAAPNVKAKRHVPVSKRNAAAGKSEVAIILSHRLINFYRAIETLFIGHRQAGFCTPGKTSSFFVKVLHGRISAPLF